MIRDWKIRSGLVFGLALAGIMACQSAIAQVQYAQDQYIQEEAVPQVYVEGDVVNGDSIGVRTPRSFVPHHLRQSTAMGPRQTVQKQRWADEGRPVNSRSQVRQASGHHAHGRVTHAQHRSVVLGETMIGESYNRQASSVMQGYVSDGIGAGCADCGITSCGGDCGMDCGDCGMESCGSCSYYNRQRPALVSFADMEYSVGVQSFKNTVNLGQGASFGVNESINWGFPLPPVLPFRWSRFSGQLGFRLTQNNFAGTAFTTDTRNQAFVTGGIFRRVDYGAQIGAAFDYLDEDWFFGGSFAQIRFHAGWVNQRGNEFGFKYAANMHEELGLAAIVNPLLPAGALPINQITPNDTYRFFYKHNMEIIQNGTVEVFGGFTSQSQGLFGTDFSLPLTDQLSVQSGFALVFEDSINTFETNLDEAWNIYTNLVFYPKGLNRWKKAYHRPLFNVADNGTFMLTR